ncbi:MAG: 1-hydroxycarotenoid 3,4-desaturase CrtD [Paracoccaceae bacterium]
MRDELPSNSATAPIIVIGAGIGGLAAALQLSHAGVAVTVLESAGAPGGKIRTVPTSAGPSDAGPTVLTMRSVFETLFADAGERLPDHVTLHPLPVLARHFWPDGTTLDLHDDPDRTAAEITRTFGPDTARDYSRHGDRAARLFDAFDAPMMQTAKPSLLSIIATVAAQPALVRDMAPHQSLATQLDRTFTDARMAQLYARYATYVGGTPDQAPALLNLVSHAEASGVWRVEGGMQALPRAIADLARARGATFHYNTPVTALQRDTHGWTVKTANGPHHASGVIFNGDPRALNDGRLGPQVTKAVPDSATTPRSLSAVVLSFAATAQGTDLSHHNVFFSDTPNAEFTPIRAGRLPDDFSLYLCAQDAHKGGLGRFEVILNAPPGLTLTPEDKHRCLTQILTRFARFRLTFHPAPTVADMTTPQDWDTLFPASLGALYGRSPDGMMAAFKRPTARTKLKGLYLAGSGAHPGAGVPMAALSGRHAAAAIMQDHALTLRSAPTAMPGGMSTGSAPTSTAPFRSSGS